jgi:hypothetical protein
MPTMGIQISNQRDINRASWIAVQAERFVEMQAGRKGRFADFLSAGAEENRCPVRSLARDVRAAHSLPRPAARARSRDHAGLAAGQLA